VWQQGKAACESMLHWSRLTTTWLLEKAKGSLLVLRLSSSLQPPPNRMEWNGTHTIRAIRFAFKQTVHAPKYKTK
jgi:hypothetical protein